MSCLFVGVQILHINSNHWVCASGFADSIECYDSLYGKIQGELEVQLAQMSSDAIRDQAFLVTQKGMQHQQGIKDCGLFAIAAACVGISEAPACWSCNSCGL